MRKFHQKQILDLLKTLSEAMDNAKGLLSEKQTSTLVNLLADCQDGAENITEFIKAVAENYSDNIIQLLTKFSETLYKTAETVQQNSPEDCHFAELKTQISDIKNCVINELKPNKIEVAFLPYKASMWDSLESIYLAAKEDPACDAYVVPIPYFDKENGRNKEMHWETDYPKNIPLTDYRKYALEEQHPDMIFIHNPYDDLNIVTGVHPNYYSSRLRGLTDCLVYVPYFVGNGISIQEHFCTLPACIFAHKVIVQTEQEKEIYQREYNKATRENSNKFLALGSPKLDKAISAKRENYEYPAEWMRIVKANGCPSKKVVFYNTSIGSLLQYTIEDNKPSNKYLQKVRSVLEFFKNCKDAVLLWRPHPLLEGTIKSMRPWLEQEYAEIVREYKNGGYGIYDDSPDLNRSIALSDVYYGDGSSVIKLFEEAKKPVVGQTFEIVGFKKLYGDNNHIWFENYFNMLYKYDKQSKKTEFVGNNNDYDTLDLINFKNFVYRIPTHHSAIQRQNTNTNEITYFFEWLGKATSFSGHCVVENEIVLVIQNMNSLLFFNMETGEYVIEKMETDAKQFNNICYDGQAYYLSHLTENYIAKWDRKTKKFSKIKLPNSFSRKDNSVAASFLIKYSNKHVWLLPFTANNAYKINVNTEKVTELPKLVSIFNGENLGWFYNCALADENCIYAATANKGIVKYCTDTNELEFIKHAPIETEIAIEPALLRIISNARATNDSNISGNKKVVLFNINAGALLANKNKYLQKIKGVFEFFKKRDDVVLLWWANSWFEREYAEIVNEFKNGNYGIYDNTGDLNRAVALSDMYYGDASNVMTPFYEAKKTVVHQAVWNTIYGFLEDGIHIWLNNFGVLYRYNKQSKETECIGVIPSPPQNGAANGGIARNGKKLYFAPFFKNNKISVFDIEKKIFEQISFKDNSKYDWKFNYVISFKNFVYFIPRDFPSIMRLNTDTKEIEYFSEWVNELSKLHISKLHEAWKNMIFWSFCVTDAEIAIVIHGANAVMFFNMETRTYEIKSVGEKSEQYNHISFDGQAYYLCSCYKDYIIKWNRQTNNIFKIKIPSFSRKENISANFSIQYLNEYVWLFPYVANNACKINVNTNEVTELPELMEYVNNKNLNWHYLIYCKSGNSIYAVTENKGILEYNVNTRELSSIEPAFADSQLLHLFSSNKIAEENFGKKIWDYLREVKS